MDEDAALERIPIIIADIRMEHNRGFALIGADLLIFEFVRVITPVDFTLLCQLMERFGQYPSILDSFMRYIWHERKRRTLNLEPRYVLR